MILLRLEKSRNTLATLSSYLMHNLIFCARLIQFLVKKLYRGSSDSTDSISTVLSIVRFPISTKLPHCSTFFFEIFVEKVDFENFPALFQWQSSISMVFPIVWFPFAPTSVLFEDPLYKKMVLSSCCEIVVHVCGFMINIKNSPKRYGCYSYIDLH